MWVQLSEDQIDLIATDLEAESMGPRLNAEGREQYEKLAENLREQVEDRKSPDNDLWVKKALSLHEDEGTIEVDQQSDDTALISEGEDGAYVMAWVFVPNEISENEEEE